MRIATHRFIAIFSMALTAAVSWVPEPKCCCARSKHRRREPEQIALTDVQIESFMALKRRLWPVIAKAPQGTNRNPKVMQQLEELVKKKTNSQLRLSSMMC